MDEADEPRAERRVDRPDTRIDLGNTRNVIAWCSRLNCTEEELRFVVRHCGDRSSDVEVFFERCR